MRVMQLIDSLELGGAERMAVTYANMLSSEVEASYLCTTRAEGPLKETLNGQVSYEFLKKENSIDRNALQRAVAFIKKEKITIIHAHSTSYFFAFLIKRQYKNVTLIWHNHHGASPKYSLFKRFVLRYCLQSFHAVIAVNKELKNWATSFLKIPELQSYYLSNFVTYSDHNKEEIDNLEGEKEQRIVCLANLKHPKEHLFLLQSFCNIAQSFPQATLHFVGADYLNDYSEQLKLFIIEKEMQEQVFIHGKQTHSQSYLNACSIGVIASSSEGLPMALLEYGRANLAVITTDVGHCADVVKDYGKIIPSGNRVALQEALTGLLGNNDVRNRLAISYYSHIFNNFSQEKMKNEIVTIYNATLG